MLKEVFFIATPIGNLEDMTLRGKRLLDEADVIIIEDYRSGKKTLDQLGVNVKEKRLIELNEHNEKKDADNLFRELIVGKQKICLISDCGMPAIADSGREFLRLCIEFGINVRYVPGASSIMGALLVSGFSPDPFHYAGFLPRKDREREMALKRLAMIPATLIIMEAPYRLPSLLVSMKKAFHKNKQIALCFDLTGPREMVFRGSLEEASTKFSDNKSKLNFVMLVDNKRAGSVFRSHRPVDEPSMEQNETD